MKKSRIYRYILGMFVLLMIIMLIYVEMRPVSIASSTVFTTEEQTEITMYVVLNTLNKIDKDKLVQDVISEHRKINGKRKNEVYTLVLYRTDVHYRKNWEYDTVNCDENGMVIHNGVN